MKTQFELEDIKAVSSTVVELITPILQKNSNKSEDIIFNQDELASYLKVSRSWVDQKISQNGIPHIKIGKYPRFRKDQIDEWLEENSTPAVPSDPAVKVKKMT